jgi:hypothetical protein
MTNKELHEQGERRIAALQSTLSISVMELDAIESLSDVSWDQIIAWREAMARANAVITNLKAEQDRTRRGVCV